MATYDGQSPRIIRALAPNAANPSYGPKKELVFDESNARVDTVVMDFAGQSVSTRPVAASSRVDTAARFSPDGSRIAFVSDRTGKEVIWTSRADGTEERALTDALATANFPLPELVKSPPVMSPPPR